MAISSSADNLYITNFCAKHDNVAKTDSLLCILWKYTTYPDSGYKLTYVQSVLYVHIPGIRDSNNREVIHLETLHTSMLIGETGDSANVIKITRRMEHGIKVMHCTLQG